MMSATISTPSSSIRRWSIPAPISPITDATLEAAQEEKLDRICRKLRLQPGQKLLDVGCGWAGLSCWAAKHYGVTVHGVTLSQAQLDYGRAKVEREGLSDRITLEAQGLSQRHRRIRRDQPGRDVRTRRLREPRAPLPGDEAAAEAGRPLFPPGLGAAWRTRSDQADQYDQGHHPLHLPRRRARHHRHDGDEPRSARFRDPRRRRHARAFRADAETLGRPALCAARGCLCHGRRGPDPGCG